MTKKWFFPFKVLKPIKEYFEKQIKNLEKRKKELEAEDPFNDVTRVTDNAAVDTDAAEEVGHERVAILKRETEKTLIRIKKALTRIKIGHYGICLGCGKMIDTDRLAADPTAEYCIDCQRKGKTSTSC